MHAFFSSRVLKILRKYIKHANFNLGVHYPLKLSLKTKSVVYTIENSLSQFVNRELLFYTTDDSMTVIIPIPQCPHASNLSFPGPSNSTTHKGSDNHRSEDTTLHIFDVLPLQSHLP